MREYDENIRLYTPIMQRIIILVAVIIAVPVVLWTITAFVRAYVAPPTLPTFRPLAANMAASITTHSVTPTSQKPVQVAAQTAGPAIATDARSSLLDIKKPAASDTPQAAAAMQASSMPTSSIAAPSTPAAPPSLPVATLDAPVIIPPPLFAAPRAMRATATAPSAVALANNMTPPPGATATSPNVVAPMPAYSVPDNPPAAFAPPDQTAMQTVSNDSATDNVSAGTPLSGRIPLPQRRPHAPPATAMNAPPGPATAAAHVALAAERAPAGVPLPRARPAAAPEPAPVEPSYPAYDPSQIH